MTLDPDPTFSIWLLERLGTASAFAGPESGSVLEPFPESQLREISPQALAYIGDAVYELFVRGCYLLPPRRIQTYHQQVVSQVRAEQQALTLSALRPHLTPLEESILKRGRNAAPTRGHRATAAVYGQATGLETLLGYLYLADPQRLKALLSYGLSAVPEPSTGANP
ncbi:Mini-ribonuclease 3 [Leptolyngbya sp. PCC 6406]|uniref:Mini-ribonuclease 3 n=1 Tax=Leptolyngbya sp. PCC 6406 TaxID=1173264 RepID=UPI0002AC9C83|nr:ribonuclease III domain-containing protein [Leptolyngbya sp. PCC 6406]